MKDGEPSVISESGADSSDLVPMATSGQAGYPAGSELDLGGWMMHPVRPEGQQKTSFPILDTMTYQTGKESELTPLVKETPHGACSVLKPWTTKM